MFGGTLGAFRPRAAPRPSDRSAECAVGRQSDLVINIGCRRRTVDPTDLKFNVLFLMNNQLGYMGAHSPSTASSPPNPFYSSNSGGGSIQITGSGAGR